MTPFDVENSHFGCETAAHAAPWPAGVTVGSSRARPRENQASRHTPPSVLLTAALATGRS